MTVETIMRRIGSIFHFEDTELLRNEAERLSQNSWSEDDIVTFLRRSEEVTGPQSEEDEHRCVDIRSALLKKYQG